MKKTKSTLKQIEHGTISVDKINTSGDVRYGVLIKSDNDYFKVGKIIIRRLKGELLYIPSETTIKRTNAIIDHFIWHKNGRVHVKDDNGIYDVLEKGAGGIVEANEKTRKKIQEIDFQEMLRDIILDFNRLPKQVRKLSDLDVIYDVGAYKGQVEFVFSIVSGKQIVACYEGHSNSIQQLSKSKQERRLGICRRALGPESGNSDKILQYCLYKHQGDAKDIPSGRRVLIPKDSGINREIQAYARKI